MLEFEFTVPPGGGEGPLERADKLVARFAPGAVSRGDVAACFARGGVSLAPGGRAVGKAERLAPGSRVAVRGLADLSDRAVRPEPDAPLAVVWREGGLVALDKPAGQPCHPLSADETGTLAGALVARFPEAAGVGESPLQPGIVHRIDTGTSGLVLAALSQESYRFVKAQFAAQTVRKAYLALVEGAVRASGGASGHLAHCDSFRGKMRVVSQKALPRGERPMFAETFWTPLRAGPAGTTLLAVEIRTGVTHQIRCHLAAAGHPVVGDALYGASPETARRVPGAPAGGHCLHSLSAEIEIPGRSRRMAVRAPDPAWA